MGFALVGNRYVAVERSMESVSLPQTPLDVGDGEGDLCRELQRRYSCCCRADGRPVRGRPEASLVRSSLLSRGQRQGDNERSRASQCNCRRCALQRVQEIDMQESCVLEMCGRTVASGGPKLS